jgi:hypothetical protein
MRRLRRALALAFLWLAAVLDEELVGRIAIDCVASVNGPSGRIETMLRQQRAHLAAQRRGSSLQ